MSALRSTLLDRHGFRHGFSTRLGGVSLPPYDSLNLGYNLGDQDDAVRENRVRFVESLVLAPGRFFEQRQVHGNHVREVAPSDAVERVSDEEGDALIARSDGIGIAVRTADCVPVLLAHPQSGAVGAVHAGWRGAVAGVVPCAIEILSRDPSELIAAVGPHIRLEAFEIGEEVALEMTAAANGRTVIRRQPDAIHGDLGALVRFQLLDAGIPEDAVDDIGGCTWTDAAQFFSHRRECGRTGRHLSAIVARAAR